MLGYLKIWVKWVKQFKKTRLPQIPLRRRTLALIEVLESRDTPTGVLYPEYLFSSPIGTVQPQSTPAPSGYTPAQIRHAYGFDQIRFANGTVAGDGAGMTIAIVDAYDNPNIASDLHQFNLAFGLPDSGFTKVNQSGGTTYPKTDAGWASEIALDVEWAHAIAPKAKILLVEATDSSYDNMFAAVAWAAKQSGVVAVSMSFGGSEFSGQTQYDSVFKTPAGHAGVTFVASSGDSGAPASYPASSPNVLSVGGTTLTLDAAGTILRESGWSGSGGGASAYEALPAYQKGTVASTLTKRATPDVSYDADPNSGFPIYDTVNNPASAPWDLIGGTSASAPQWAALVAIADQGRSLAGLTSLDGATQTLPQIYAMPASNFHDITTGRSTGSPSVSALAGYDMVTGRGTPFANLVVASLTGQTTTTPPVTNPPPVTPTVKSLGVSVAKATVVAGTADQITISALDSTGKVVTDYLGKVTFSSTDVSAGLPATYTFTAADKGVHVFNLVLKTAGTQRVTITDTANALSSSSSITVSPAAPAQILFDQQPALATVGSVISPAVKIRLVDQFGNLATNDNSDQVTLRLGANPGNASLQGTTKVTVSQGIATFANLSLSALGNGYTLVASSGTLKEVASATFKVVAVSPSRTLLDFENASTWNIVGGSWWNNSPTARRSSDAAHDGTSGLVDTNGDDWIYRNDSTTKVKAGETVSTWLKFADAADGRAYFGFGASNLGTYSLVAAPNSGELQLQLNAFYGYTTLATVSQSYLANHWYRLEVTWGTDGKLVGKLFDSDGSTLLQTVSATNTLIKSGGIALRATGSDKYWDSATAATTTTAVLPNNNTSAGNTKTLSHQSEIVGQLLQGDEPATLTFVVNGVQHIRRTGRSNPSGLDLA